ncbi:hypothetical protein CYLTODRAFT_459594 [Cylindrobasidium torrendii FP15055 ss-10]|uniref:Uncharacterized protein n=1 Tax=Cylindrobasidium torrendii FP15055 ss-10 TaxID=1314674 RepID=A0A0D7AUU8_9AGAR|nr:hypothetical protein CYLTODRAFT_459594 [Cylindrobasidium torrendii FP15055 ss-10]
MSTTPPAVTTSPETLAKPMTSHEQLSVRPAEQLVQGARLVEEDTSNVMKAATTKLLLAEEELKALTDDLKNVVGAMRDMGDEEARRRTELEAAISDLRERLDVREGEVSRVRSNGDVTVRVRNVSQVEVVTVGPGDKRVRMRGLEGGIVAELIV